MEAVPPSAGTGASIPCMEIPHRLIDVGAVMLVAAEPPQEAAVSATVISATAEAMRSRNTAEDGRVAHLAKRSRSCRPADATESKVRPIVRPPEHLNS